MQSSKSSGRSRGQRTEAWLWRTGGGGGQTARAEKRRAEVQISGGVSLHRQRHADRGSRRHLRWPGYIRHRCDDAGNGLSLDRAVAGLWRKTEEIRRLEERLVGLRRRDK